MELFEAVTPMRLFCWLTLLSVLGIAPVSSRAEDATVTYKSISPELALEAAQASLKQCQADGFQVTVVVIDRFGEPLVLLRDRYAGLPSPHTAADKAWTALGFKSSTSELSRSVQSGKLDARLASLPRVTMLSGGVLIEAEGTAVGAIGVSGALGGDKDEACAKAGLARIQGRLDF